MDLSALQGPQRIPTQPKLLAPVQKSCQSKSFICANIVSRIEIQHSPLIVRRGSVSDVGTTFRTQPRRDVAPFSARCVFTKAAFMSKLEKANGGSASVGVIAKVLRILEALQGSSGGLGLKAICGQTGINKSTAHRFLKHLERERYLLRTEGGAYLIGPRLSQLSSRGDQEATLQVVARPILWDLWKSTQETINLGVLDQGTVLYIDVIESPHEFRLSSRVGTRRSVHVTALGKALVAFLPSENRHTILDSIAFQPATPRTIGNLVQFRQELEKIRRQGYAVDDEEAVQGARCVSAPILNSAGTPIAAVSVSGPVTRVTPALVNALAGAVTSAAHAISAAMGFSPYEPKLNLKRTKQLALARN
jgi:DNA-binding IclR family transcriptional regulator